jgi:hypothetical protein
MVFRVPATDGCSYVPWKFPMKMHIADPMK